VVQLAARPGISITVSCSGIDPQQGVFQTVKVLKHPLLHWQGLHSKANGELCFKKKEVFPQLLLAFDFYASVASVGNRLPDHCNTIALLSSVPPELENRSSKTETAINLVYSLRVMHILDLMC
jgi:hypothetical protein